MIRVFKWLWDKAEQNGRNQIIWQLEGLAAYHRNQAEIKTLKEVAGIKDESEFEGLRILPNLTPKEHSAVSCEVGHLLTTIYRKEESMKDNDGR